MVHKSKVALLVILVSLFSVILVLLWGSIPIFAIAGERWLVKWGAKNPYIDSAYAGWKTVQISDIGTIMIPVSWSINESNGISYISNENGEIWATGTIFGHENAKFHSYKSFAEKIYQKSFADAFVQPYTPFYLMDGSTVAKIVDDCDKTLCYCVKLFITMEQEYVLLIETDITNDARQYDIVEAIVYSYAFS